MLLTDEEISNVMEQGAVEGERYLPYAFARAIEAKIMERLGEPVAWFDDYEIAGCKAVSFDHRSGGVPLYQLPSVQK